MSIIEKIFIFSITFYYTNEEELAQVAGGADSTDDRDKPPKTDLNFSLGAEDSGRKPQPSYSDLPKFDYTKQE